MVDQAIGGQHSFVYSSFPTPGFTEAMKRRNLGIHACACLAVIALGLASRRFPGLFPAALGKYPGDALWALMMFFCWGILLPRASTAKVACAALATAYAVEISQLYQAPWINAVRSTTLGHLVLGSAFHWLDLLAYAIGVSAGAFVERLFGLDPSPGSNRRAW
ncbi:ribosomal maturation YjgA family protein [Chitinimonas koreensis]|uniref:ribosomal maturation YjgA family protein n=1 Tax=Chitinimonas koreensis TaxID=356302 RepID=UPI001FDF6D66|nr:DUF2809 domain-containing protein [Chitinimonas koreensis]